MITVLKSKDGYRWIAVSSTAYKDRDKEIVSTEALRKAVKAKRGKNLGTLRFWHERGLDIGTTDYQELTDDNKYLIESGIIPDTEVGRMFVQALKSGDYQMSIGFVHPLNEPDSDGVFHNIDIFERSIVPNGYAANPQTRIIVGKE